MSFNYLIPVLGTVAALMSSCVPFNPYGSNSSQSNPDSPTTSSGGSNMVNSPEQEGVRQARQDVENEAEGSNGDPEGSNPPEGNGGGNGTSEGGADYRRAILIPGKEGFVFNPFTNNPVDVRGIPSGTKVRDPQDPNKEHIFRVP